MKIWYNRKSNDPTYFIQYGYRNGKKTSTRNVAVIGKHSELLRITDDPLAYAKQKVAEYNEQMKDSKVTMEVKIDFDEKVRATNDLVSSSTSRNIGYFFLQAIYNDLAIDKFFKDATARSRATFDINEVIRFLTYARILDPDSKLGTCNHLSSFYEQPSFQYQHVLRTMDILNDNYDSYISHLFKHSNTIVKRDTSVCYFDCTNYYFETECEDPDYVDEVTGEVVKGFHKYAVSKEHLPSPLVEMGLFMDANGIPLSMCIAPGSDSEQTIAVPEEEKLTSILNGKKFIYCADAGLGSYDIRQFNSMGGRAFVITQSIKKLSDALKLAVFNDYDYKLMSDGSATTISSMKSFDKEDPENRELYNDYAYKILYADKAVDVGLYEDKVLKSGKVIKVKSKAKLKQKLIITFSRKSMEYQRYIRDRQIKRAKDMLGKLDPATYKKGPNDVTRFIKHSHVGTGKDTYFIDQERIAEEEKYDGYYAVATNLSDDIKTVIGISENRYKIEDCFRVMKTNFSARPVYHQLRSRITAHFMICYTALLIYRLLEVKINTYAKTLLSGAVHFTTDNIIETLQNMNVNNIQDMYYQSSYNGSQTLDALNAIYDLKLDRKYYQPKELNRKLKKISGREV